MRLIGVSFRGFRRLAATGIRIDAPLVAIVGPNEAGKTSLLRALVHLNDADPFSPSDFTRGATQAAGEAVITATYALEAGDHERLALITEAREATKYILMKNADGKLSASLDPPPRRDITSRLPLALQLYEAANQEWMPSDVAEQLNGVAPLLDSEAASLPESTLSLLEDARDSLAAIPEAASLLEHIDRSIETEREEHPNKRALSELRNRRPRYLWFGDDERTLASEYELGGDRTTYPTALRQLAALANLDLAALTDAVLAGDYGSAETLEERANARLAHVFRDAWRQSSLIVRLRLDETRLRILVSNTAGEYTSIAERSEGLRAFVSLVAFVALNPGEVPPVILVDEAESHLHYDAQADLVRVFTRQPVASHVIYTTHSAGCLPEDLGTGVRALEPTTGDRTVIHDSVWTKGPGFTPLILAMGASVTAFAPTRLAVLAEGPSEAILLPSLLREAAGVQTLGYQVAPGLASAAPETARNLELEAPRVAYLVDGDEAGAALRERLQRAGVPATAIASLGRSGTGLSLEDFVRPEIYRAAVNEELRLWQRPGPIPESAIPAKGRSRAVADWCRKHRIEPPGKPAVASRILQMFAGRSLVMPTRRAMLQRLHEQLLSILQRPSS